MSVWSINGVVWCGVVPQEQQQLLATYQGLVVKQLVSQSQTRKQEDAEGDCHKEGEAEEEVRSQLVNLMPQVKDLVLSQKKTPGTEEWTFQTARKLIAGTDAQLFFFFNGLSCSEDELTAAANLAIDPVFLWADFKIMEAKFLYGMCLCKSNCLESPQWGSDHLAAIKVLVTACESFWIGVRLPARFQPGFGLALEDAPVSHLLVHFDESKWMGRTSITWCVWTQFTRLALSKASPFTDHMGAPNTNNFESDSQKLTSCSLGGLLYIYFMQRSSGVLSNAWCLQLHISVPQFQPTKVLQNIETK